MNLQYRICYQKIGIIIKTVSLLYVVCIYMSCNKKSDFLAAKPSVSLLIPKSFDDFQQLLDNTGTANGYFNQVPEAGEESADDYYMTSDFYNGLFLQKDRNTYIWASDIYGGVGNVADWNVPYSQVLTCNAVLEGLNKVTPTDNISRQKWNNLKGSALFFRAFAFYNLAQLFAPPYDSITAASDLGIPLRLSSEINQTSTRASVRNSYNQIIFDLKTAATLLNASIDYNNRNRPSRPAALALLARVYLSMRQYQDAFNAANGSLQLYSKLVDYNTLNATSAAPFSSKIDESLLFATLGVGTYGYISIWAAFSQGVSIDTALYNQYTVNDLRKSLYFHFSGNYIKISESYSGYWKEFTGLATDELFLIRAECYARQGDANSSMNDLNTLLLSRWKTGTFIPFTASNAASALAQVLVERRKELVQRGIRWSDIRRLNKEGYNITPIRLINGQTYTLPPGDPRYVLPIPPDVVSLSGIQQNQR